MNQKEYFETRRKHFRKEAKKVLTGEDILFLRALEGANFAELCGQLGQESSDLQENAMRAAGLLKTWVQDGLVVCVDNSND